MYNRSPIRILAAGITASAVMMAIVEMMPWSGAPGVDAVTLLSTFSTQFGSLVPLAQYLFLSVLVFPVLYAVLLSRDLPGPPWLKGTLWGVILFALRGLIVLPIMGQGLFALRADHALSALITMFFAHCVYGLLLGSIIGDQSKKKVKVYARAAKVQGRR